MGDSISDTVSLIDYWRITVSKEHHGAQKCSLKTNNMHLLITEKRVCENIRIFNLYYTKDGTVTFSQLNLFHRTVAKKVRNPFVSCPELLKRKSLALHRNSPSSPSTL